MTDNTVRLDVTRVSEATAEPVGDEVAREAALTIFFNDMELVTMLCSPAEENYLAAGFLAAEGLIESAGDITSMTIDGVRGIARVTAKSSGEAGRIWKRFISSGCGRGATFYSAADVASPPVVSSMKLHPDQIYRLMKDFQERSEVFKTTGGVHAAALAAPGGIELFSEDIGRHNAVDKVFGRCLIEGIGTKDRMLLVSGRISSEILLKTARRGIPFLISRSAPTDSGVKLAEKLGITLIGFVRGHRMNIYANPERLVTVKGPGTGDHE
ncbi:formate dehydrogenase accessory sulfurtransferase FdhD [Dehalogenimonas alkenigignens]|uniref:Sulfur carrier protein FdhD n=1 Tax=Dehalogenimonas alkenigignens TaxID=1217799 RepID=A0A0W0GL23_9CHLR|nr:formate dehydrogenase accessory sulfurtransferase FdhD [Dehalogenimonas alkenigignens]KTB49262.1 formate dehydrogenase family accessory protein FdhD [Dehalogenimonas alkenigignens]PVV83763.1 formate dehydrogenase accessory sulfurtransferase FdhD [Dehalogenimonas alkenigignens]